MNCLFCSTAKHEIGSEVVYEDERTLAFLDIHPRAPGHTVVISKHHSRSILELPEGEIEPLFLAVKNTTAKIARALEPDGFTIGINHGAVSGQTVDHLHVHILPRFNGDGGSSIHSVVSNPPKASLKEIAEKIKSA